MPGSAPASRWRLLPATVAGLVLGGAIATIAVPRSGDPATSYGAVSTPMRAAELAAGLGLVTAGLVSWLSPGGRRVGLLAILAAVVWFAPDWEGWERGEPVVRSLGAAVAPVFVVLILHLVLAAPRGRIESRRTRAGLVVAYGIALVLTVGRALVRDPLFDPTCWRNCLDNVFLVHGDRGVVEALEGVWLRTAVAFGGVAIAIGLWRLVTATAPARRALLPIVVPGVVVAVTEVAFAITLLREAREDPSATAFSTVFYARSAAVVLLAVGVLWTVARSRRLVSLLGRLTAELGDAPAPGTLRAVLSAEVGDPTLAVAYPLPGSDRYVGANGRPVAKPTAGDGRAVTPIARDGRELALVVHDAALLDGSGFAREIGSAARLAVENERLQAEVLAQLEELRASRARVVERGDAERRHLERNLHDGAQQRMLALSYDLRLARTAAAGDAKVERLLATAESEAQTALGELRRLAHGIFPAVLAEAGLGPALATLADEAPLPVELGEVPGTRFAASVETAAYVTVAEAVDDAVRRDATYVSVDVAASPEQIAVVAQDDGAARTVPLVEVADRVGALGGSVEAGATVLRAEIPCA